MSGKFGQKQDRTRIVLPDSAPTSQSWQHFDPLQRPPGSLHDFFIHLIIAWISRNLKFFILKPKWSFLMKIIKNDLFFSNSPYITSTFFLKMFFFRWKNFRKTYIGKFVKFREFTLVINIFITSKMTIQAWKFEIFRNSAFSLSEWWISRILNFRLLITTKLDTLWWSKFDPFQRPSKTFSIHLISLITFFSKPL